MKVIEGWVKNLLRLTFLKRNLKLVGLGMTTRFDGRTVPRMDNTTGEKVFGNIGFGDGNSYSMGVATCLGV